MAATAGDQHVRSGSAGDEPVELGVDTVRMREVKDLMDERLAAGHGDQGFGSLIELLDAR